MKRNLTFHSCFRNSICRSSLGHSLAAVVKQLTGKNWLQGDDEYRSRKQSLKYIFCSEDKILKQNLDFLSGRRNCSLAYRSGLDHIEGSRP